MFRRMKKEGVSRLNVTIDFAEMSPGQEVTGIPANLKSPPGIPDRGKAQMLVGMGYITLIPGRSQGSQEISVVRDEEWSGTSVDG